LARLACSVAVVAAVSVAAVPTAGASAAPALVPAAQWHAVGPRITPAAGAVGEVLLSVRKGVDPQSVLSRVGMTAARTVPGRPDLIVAETAPGAEAASAARLLAANTDAVSAVPNAVARIAAVPNDDLFKYQWHLADRSVAAGSSNWAPTWGSGVTGAGVTVAVLDTGVTAHADLDGVLAGWDFIGNDADPHDEHGHGTHVAGTIAESTGNTLGAAGVASGASILPVRVLDATGTGSYDKILSGLAFAVSNGAKVVNLSFAGDSDAGLCKAVADAAAAGVLVIAAAGNDGGPVAYPAACPSAIAVSAVDITGALAPYSNRGPQIVIAAPGGSTCAANPCTAAEDRNHDGYPDGVLQYTFTGTTWGYYFEEGTSMASPHVAGAAALVLQARPGASVSQLRSLLTSTATDLGSPGVDSSFGSGLLDISAAVQAAKLPASPSTTTTTTSTTATTVASTGSTTTTSSTVPSNTTTTAPATTTTTTPHSASVQRVSGDNRYATAATASANSWPNGSSDVYLATGTSYADALATGGLAGTAPGPLLLVGSCSLPAETSSELQRLHPGRITVVGGPGAVCDAVASDAGRITGASVVRRSGPDRYSTAVALSQAGFPQTAPTVYLASGETFADGLSGGALAARGRGPLLLSARCALPAVTGDELVRLSPKRVVVMGGEGAICNDVIGAVQARLPGATVDRVSGADRFATSVAAADMGWPDTSGTVYVAGGGGFADGLAAGVAAAGAQAPLLLVPACGEVPASVTDAIRRLRPTSLVVVGGPAAVCEQVLERLRQAVSG